MPAIKKKHPKEKPQKVKSPKLFIYKQLVKTIFWFMIGVFFGLFLLTSVSYFIFQQVYHTSIYPGVYIDGINFGGKTQAELRTYFNERNKTVHETMFTFTLNGDSATVSASQLHIGYDSVLLAQQAYVIGRSSDGISNASVIFQAYLTGVTLTPAYTFSEQVLQHELESIIQKNAIPSVNAIFDVQNGKVVTFQPSSNGQEVDLQRLQQEILQKIPYILLYKNPQHVVLSIPLRVLKPKIATSDVNHLGITQLIGTGTSLFQESIPGRIANVELAASRINGALVAPGQVFSFDQTLGDVSAFTGYQQAYVIENGKTVLGDGGGVCQVSTTLFRALLNAGLPIVERHAHAYRVGYYEEGGSPPGLDATVFVPTVDLKFQNDTGHYILIQTVVDPYELRLTFMLYGTSDGRSVSMTTPVVTNYVPPLPTIYTDDPTLPSGTLKETDFAAAGATVTFSRTVMKNGKVYIADTYVSNYQPWAAAYLRGTK